MHLKLTAWFRAAPEGGFTCGFEELPDVFSEGETLDEAKVNLFDALELVMEYHRDESKKTGAESVVTETYDLEPA